MQLKKTENIIILTLATTLLLTVFGIVLVIINSQKLEQQRNTSFKASPIPTDEPFTSKPPLVYNKDAEDKLIDYIQHRRTLSKSDISAKASILTVLSNGEQSGILYESSTIIIDYIHSADVFQVEILTPNIQAAKDEANIWFRTHGISQKGICTLPVEFYVNYEVGTKLRHTNIIFNPQGNGC